MKIHPIITNNSLQNIFYILECGEKKAIVIDPSDSELTGNFLEENSLKLESIFITHEHDDHYSGVPGLDCNTVYASQIASDNMPIKVTNIVSDGDLLFEEDNVKIRVISSPGHSFGHIMFEVSIDEKIHAIFVGDTLFSGGVGHVYRGDAIMLYDSVQKFKRYSEDVMIYSGHDYMENNFNFIKRYFPERAKACNTILQGRGGGVYFTNLGEERKINPFLACDKKEFIRLRELRNNW